jgi:ubiquinone/menaquinone biosynthesis C-methylase UbiE
MGRILRRFFGFPHLLRRIQYPLIERRLDKLKPDSNFARILDIGCGGGELVERLSHRFYTIGIDPVTQAYPIPGRAFFLRGRGEGLPFPDQFFDALTLSSVLQMVREEKPLLAECRRVLKPNGRLILTVPVDYRFIPVLFRRAAIFRLIRRVIGFPEDLILYREQLNVKHRTNGRGYYQENEVATIIRDAGFELTHREYAPRALGSFIYEACLLVRSVCRLNVSVYGMTGMMLYPLGWFDRWLPKDSRGCELLIDARRTAT